MNNNINKISIPLAVTLLMFPQIIETMYSPALTSIKTHFGVIGSTAAQGMSVFFVAFAIGVVFWGRMCDTIGRRHSTLVGLIIFISSAIFTLYASTFTLLLISFSCCAFGAAVGSVCTQTILRDCYQGPELGRAFSIIGTAIGISPIIGMLVGSWLTVHGGYKWVFIGMAILTSGLLCWCLMQLPETKPAHTQRGSLLFVAIKMLKDLHVWYIVLMVAIFNIALFSYYSLAPFMFEKLNVSIKLFGYTSAVLALGSIFGAMFNMRLLRQQIIPQTIITLASIILLISSSSVYLLQNSIWFFLPMIFVSLSFGLALPNLLSTALNNYRDHLGSAGALLGLFYYLIIGAGLHKAAIVGNLGITLIVCAILAITLTLFHRFYNAIHQ
ncbi:MFS transporter [Photobacterium sp. S4TG1]|uniref:MFS transporter n=1 Tax=Photobacterium sp. S4TG1 TaxID=3114587 RepID=UPI002E187205|nr:MFS transporter [Photobacterium sp. S4TG1]